MENPNLEKALQSAVIAKLAYWDALQHLESKVSGKQLTDRASDKLVDLVDDLAVAFPAEYDSSSVRHLVKLDSELGKRLAQIAEM